MAGVFVALRGCFFGLVVLQYSTTGAGLRLWQLELADDRLFTFAHGEVAVPVRTNRYRLSVPSLVITAYRDYLGKRLHRFGNALIASSIPKPTFVFAAQNDVTSVT